MRLRRKNALLICLLLNKQQRKILSDLLISHTLSMGLSHSDKSTENEKKKHIKSWGWVKKINVGNFCLSRPLARHCQTMSSEHSPVTSPTIQNQKNVWQNKPISDWFHVKKGQYSWETLTKQSFFFFFGWVWMVTTSFQGQHSWKTHRSTQKKPGEQVRASGTHTSLSRVRNIWLMTLSEKKVMASHCTKDGEKMEQRPSPVLAERKRTWELSPCSSPHTQHQADKLPHHNISALPSTFVTNNSQKGKGRAVCPDSALQARLPSAWLRRAPSPSWLELQTKSFFFSDNLQFMGPVSTGAVSWYFSHSPAIWKPVRGSRRQAILITSPCWARKAAAKRIRCHATSWCYLSKAHLHLCRPGNVLDCCSSNNCVLISVSKLAITGCTFFFGIATNGLKNDGLT